MTLKIKLGNDAMQTPEDIADALRRTADRITDSVLNGATFNIRDTNGNTVGQWKVTGRNR